LGEISINKLPAPTWTWLKVNEKNISVPSGLVRMNYEKDNVPAEISASADAWEGNLTKVELSAGEDFRALSDESTVESDTYIVPDGVEVENALRLIYSPEDGSLNRTAFKLGKGAKLTAVLIFKGKAAFAANDIRIEAEEDAELRLVEVFQMEEGTTLIDSIGGCYAERAALKLTQITADKGHISLGCAAELNGAKSCLDIDTGYLVTGEDSLDINYVARHRGEFTDSKINVSGVLRDQASKIFRGTIDFIKGCKEATGDEREDVLLMDEGVRNSTVPLILCAEEDVEGSHGASIGKISEDILLYMQSRGIPEADITEIMAKSRIAAVAGLIPDEKTREMLLAE
jgi:Fe-S cluster assembly scaffold protein SufB